MKALMTDFSLLEQEFTEIIFSQKKDEGPKKIFKQKMSDLKD